MQPVLRRRILGVGTVVFSAAISSISAVAEPASSYDITVCGAAIVTTISASQELSVLSIDTKGIARSTPEKGAFDNATFQCVGVLSLAGAHREGTNYCKFLDLDGDFVVGQTMLDSSGGGTWKFLQGTGKWKGITGGGKLVPLASGKPIVPSTAQSCSRATGTFELSK